jgi:hypothetical protein
MTAWTPATKQTHPAAAALLMQLRVGNSRQVQRLVLLAPTFAISLASPARTAGESSASHRAAASNTATAIRLAADEWAAHVTVAEVMFVITVSAAIDAIAYAIVVCCRITTVDWSNSSLEVHQLPAAVLSMTQLTTLSLQGTVLVAGPLPISTGDVSNLQVLRISGGPNNLGSLPQDWSIFPELNELSLYNMDLSGALPAEYSDMVSLSKLGLYNITFADGLAQLPADWSNLQVTQFVLNNIKGLSGSLPSSWSGGGWPQLVNLSVQHVPSLFATLDDWWGFINRPGAPLQQTVMLNDNGMQGTIPAGMIDANR